MEMNPSPQQQAVIDHLGDPRSGSLVVEARAGGGKTTCILEAAYRATDPTILLCAFNRHIADELTSRVQARGRQRGKMIKAQTLHSIGLEIVRQKQPGVSLDRDATDELVKAVCPSTAFPVRRVIVKLVRYIKETCTPFDDQPALGALLGNLGYADALSDPLAASEVILGAQEAMRASKDPRPILDFCDMIWLPHALDLAPRGRYRCVVVDEAQDLSLGQFYLIEHMLAPGGRIIVVGDLHQEIYSWRGAVGPTIWRLMREKYQAKTLPLTWSFRCPRMVIDEARILVPDISAAPGAPDGTVDRMALADAISEMQIGDFFLARTNAGVVTNAIRAHLQGITVRVLGGWEELGPLLDLLKKMDCRTKDTFRKSLGDWYVKEMARSNLTQEQAERIEDRNKLLSEAATIVPPSQLADAFRYVFREASVPAVVFSTVHKAKGLEALRVFLLRSTFGRHRRRRDGSFPAISDLPVEELNVEYVAVTRSMNHLTWVLDEDSGVLDGIGG